jgi:arylsulfatase A-like enzyme
MVLLRNFLLANLLLYSLSTGTGIIASNSNSKPNIILLLTDDQRWDTLGSYGNSFIHTPNLDRLAESGTVFENMFVTTSICATSRASILTGQYARRHGVWDFQTELTENQLDKSYLGTLRKAGYKIGFIGKWGIGNPPRDWFDYDRTFPGQGQYWVNTGNGPRHLTSLMADQAVEFISGFSNGDRPFCLSVSFKAAHVQDSYSLSDIPFPYDPEFKDLYSSGDLPFAKTSTSAYFDQLPDFLKNSEARLRWAIRFWGPARAQESIKGYYRLISGVDAAVGRITQALRNSGCLENTVIIFTGDNGFYLGEHGLAGKWFAHEPSIRVPLIVSIPHITEPARKRVTDLALNIDLAPTIIELAGETIPPEMQGKSLLKTVFGSLSELRSEIFYEHLFEHPRIAKSEAIRTSKWKYVRYIDFSPAYEELYDLENDPDEAINLALKDGYGQELKELREKIEQLRKSAE